MPVSQGKTCWISGSDKTMNFDLRHSRFKNLSTWILFILIPLMTFLSCSARKADMLSKAAEQVSLDFIFKAKEKKQCGKINEIGVWPLKNDPDDIMRKSLEMKLSEMENFTGWIPHMAPETDELKKVMEDIVWMIKHKKLLDQKSRITLGRLKQPKYVIYGNIVRVEQGPNAAYIKFQGEILGLEEGRLLYSNSLAVKYVENPGIIQGLIITLIALMIFIVFFGISITSTIYVYKYKQLAVLVCGFLLATCFLVYMLAWPIW